eukprot:COSAG02_NODE_2740_length_8124_cov_16.189283_4_plen_919_part_00
MIQRLTLERATGDAAGHWAPGPPPERESPSTPRHVRAERELAEWLGRKAVFGATPAGVGALLLGRGVPCEAWTATVAEMSERQLGVLIDEAASREEHPVSSPEEAPQPRRDVAAPQSDPQRPVPAARAQPGGPPIVPIATSDVTVTFGAGSLGLAMGENPAWIASSYSGGDTCFSAVVDRLNPEPDGSPGPAERTGVIHVADLLSAVDGRSVATVPYRQVVGMIKVAPRPLTLSFRSPQGPTAPDSGPKGRAPRLASSAEEGVPPTAAEPDAEPPRGHSTSPRAEDAAGQPAPSTTLQAPVPAASLPQDIVHTVTQTASWVAKHGDAFEQTIRRRNEGNPSFGFLFDEQSEAAAFYRACLAWEACGRGANAASTVASATEETTLTSTDEISQAGQDLFQRINAAHADISDRIGQASADIESMQAADVQASGGDSGGKQVEAWAVLQELKLQEDVLQALRAKAKSTGGELDAGSSAMMEMTFSRVVTLTEQLADLELGQDTSPLAADRERSHRPKSAPPRNIRRTASESRMDRSTPGYAQHRGRPAKRNSRSRSRKRSGTPEMMRYPERRPTRNARRVAAAGRPRSKSTGHRRRATSRGSARYSVEHGRARSVSTRGSSRRGPARSKSRGGQRPAKSWVDATSDRLNDTLWAEYSQAPPFGASSDRFWPEVFPSSRHRSQSFHRGSGGEETPGPGSYSEHQPMGKRASSMNWRIGNDDLYAFLKAAGAEDQLPAFWREQFFRVRDLVDPELGVLIDEHDLVTELGVTNSAARRKLLRQATAVLRSTLAMRKHAKAGHNGSGTRFGGHGSHLGHNSTGTMRGRDVPGPGAYSPRDSSFQVPKRTNALYFTSSASERSRGHAGTPRTTPRRARSPSPPNARQTPSRSRSRRRGSSSSSGASTRGSTPNSRRVQRRHKYDDY